MAIKPKTVDPGAIIRDGYIEPERAFPAPPTPIMEGDLDKRAFEILEFVVQVYRLAQHRDILRSGVDWATLQRWYDVKGNHDRNRIYAAVRFLVREGYLQPGPSARYSPLGIGSHHVTPTEKGYLFADRRQAPILKKLWLEMTDRRGTIAVVSTAIAAIVGLVSAIIALS